MRAEDESAHKLSGLPLLQQEFPSPRTRLQAVAATEWSARRVLLRLASVPASIPVGEVTCFLGAAFRDAFCGRQLAPPTIDVLAENSSSALASGIRSGCTRQTLRFKTKFKSEMATSEDMDLQITPPTPNTNADENGDTRLISEAGTSISQGIAAHNKATDGWQLVLSRRQEKASNNKNKINGQPSAGGAKGDGHNGETGTGRSNMRPTKWKPLPPLPNNDIKIILKPHKGLMLKEYLRTEIPQAIIRATRAIIIGNGPNQRQITGEDFILRIREGPNIIIVSTPSLEVADVIRRITCIELPGKRHPFSVYVADPEDSYKGVQHLGVRTQGVSIERARMLGSSNTALLTFPGGTRPKCVYYMGVEMRCTECRPTIQMCLECMQEGHRSDVCPNPKNICRHECEVRSVQGGGARDARSSGIKSASGVGTLPASAALTTLHARGARGSTSASKGSIHSWPLPSKPKNSWQLPPPKRSIDAMRDFSPLSSVTSPMSSSVAGATSSGLPSPSRTPTSKADHGIHGSPLRTLLQSTKASVAAALVMIATTLAVLIWLMASSQSHEKDSSAACRSEECHQYAKRLRESLNESVDPCTDFTRYVCDGWRRRHQLSVAEEAFMWTFDRMSKFVRSIEVPQHDQTAVTRAAAFYRSCVSVLRGERDEISRVKRAMAAAGITWPKKPKAVPDLLHTLLYVHLQLRWSVLFSIDVTSNTERSFNHAALDTIDRSGAPKKTLELMREPKKVIQYFNTLVSAFGEHAKQDSERVTFTETNTIATKVFRTIYKGLLKASGEPQAVNTTMLFQSVPNLSQARWRFTFRSLGIAEHVLLETSYPTYVRQFFGLWRDLGESRLHLFLSCKAYLLSGATVLRSSSSYALVGDARVQAEQLLWSIREAFLRHGQGGRYDENAAISKLLALSDQEFAVSAFAVFDENAADNTAPQHIGHADITSSLVDNWMAAALPHATNVSHIASTAIERLSFATATTDGRVVLMPYAFSFPFFDARGTLAMNYAGVGFHVAYALSQLSLLPFISDTDGPLYRFYNCTGMSSNATNSSSERILNAFSAFATQPLFDAFVNASAALGTNDSLPGLPALSGSQLFFVSLCYAKCRGS
ncbi:hypothetical protein HPB49_020024 [Dermacentor silvarum]|uniref:Uncharacterized protein n=1 Tax=Dermacentor silvarum TaxID=543639 RepID=A0ACB8D7A5_DERSI|nr:hypothetical protein HPB49_020024 [Dermacentor silvarum]